MDEKIIIYLHEHAPAHPDWVVVNQDGVCINHVVRGEPSQLAELTKQRHTMVIVPAESILLTSVTLPKMNRARLIKAIPFALEEQLIEDVEKLHFASGEFQENGALPVAIVAHEKMQRWTALLSEWQVLADALVPLTLALPLQDNQLSIVVDYVANVRTSAYQGFACDQDNLTDCLTLAFAEQNLPSSIHVLNTTGRSSANAIKLKANISEDMIKAAQLLDIFAESILHHPYINLLQADYSNKKSRLPQTDKLIKITSVLIASWLLLLILYPAVSYIILGSKLSDINSGITQIYKRNFPLATNMVAPKSRLADKLHSLEAKTGENRFLLLLGYIGKGLNQGKNVKLKHIDFQNGQLTMELSAASSDDFSAFSDYLTSQGLTVKQQNATLNGARVSATLQVE